MKYNPHNDSDPTRLFVAVFLAALLLMAWQYFVQWPRKQQYAQLAIAHEQQVQQQKEQHLKAVGSKESPAEENADLTLEQRLDRSPRLAIRSEKLHGSIALRGARFDDLTLAKYKETLDPQSPEVRLLSPAGDAQAYFAHIGWVATDGTRVPDQNSVWQSDKTSLAPGETAHLRWDNGSGQRFVLSISLDGDYMFTVAQRVENNASHAVSLGAYGYLNRTYDDNIKHYGIMHEGPLGVMESSLEEISYKDLREKGAKEYNSAGGWLGITDKYWQAALIPGESGYKASFSHYVAANGDRYQADYLMPAQSIAPGGSDMLSVRLFAGAKEVNVLDGYAQGSAENHMPPIPLFDRSVDFGVLYLLTKPMFLTLNFFYQHTGNFGIAILLLTIVVKLLMFPLANKSYKSMAQMKRIQPEMVKLRERYVDDTIALNKAMLELYKREKINPASGCLPLLLQMPVFFALYKVLYVTIEMRHAPFFGWLRDLSAPDPSNVFTLLGYVPWDNPAWLHLGILPILYTASMIVQMKLQPAPADPVQAKMMAFMPYFFLFIFAGFPAGLVLYWVWSNILSILQQQVISRRHGDKRGIRGS